MRSSSPAAAADEKKQNPRALRTNRGSVLSIASRARVGRVVQRATRTSEVVQKVHSLQHRSFEIFRRLLRVPRVLDLVVAHHRQTLRLLRLVHSAHQHDVLPADDVQTQRDVAVGLVHDDPLDRALENDVRELIERAQRPQDLASVAKQDEELLVELVHEARDRAEVPRVRHVRGLGRSIASALESDDARAGRFLESSCIVSVSGDFR
eukprot:29053-Pelagococcus_subviridis.AAC.4